MDERQLRILRELGALGSVRAVANTLGITPSAVSQQLKLLQRPIPVPLTRRHGRTLRLTEAGERLAAAGADVQAALARAREVARDLSRSPGGTVTVSAFNSAAVAFFPSLAHASPGAAPVRVALSDEDVAQSEFPQLTAAYDVVLAHRLPHTPAWPATVTVVPLLNEPLDLALPANHPLAGRDSVDALQVAAEPWITTHAGFPVGALLDTVAAVSGRPVEVRHRVNEFTVAAELVRAGAGLALIPRWTSLRPAGVVLRPLTGVRVARRVDALIRPERTVRPAAREVLAPITSR
ncbi:LysR family transcriptional regulator [Jiangella asiatica]|uniref:LysR family transcriptional regulator n=1 Tax=Jiangella asiatica TaxID=2530372 RepID=A0A4R5D7J1_9ACTN|nr:LysR family transcriptional regulator [Jiangella asiatica]TDE08627.1 LysR family transcriptional regulator [Jiangella asiatica]